MCSIRNTIIERLKSNSYLLSKIGMNIQALIVAHRNAKIIFLPKYITSSSTFFVNVCSIFYFLFCTGFRHVFFVCFLTYIFSVSCSYLTCDEPVSIGLSDSLLLRLIICRLLISLSYILNIFFKACILTFSNVL